MQNIVLAFKGEKKVGRYLLYEFFGTMFLCWAYLMGGRTALIIAPLIAYVVCWDKCPNHFNLAVTIGEAMYNSDELLKTWQKYLLIVIMQFCGALGAIFFVFVCQNQTYPNAYQKIFHPNPPRLCPTLNGGSCVDGTEMQVVIKWEFMTSCFWVFSFLIIRNFQKAETYSGIANILKPFFAF